MNIHLCYSCIGLLLWSLKLCNVINGQPNPDVTVPDSTVTLGEDAIITCTYTISDGRTLAAVSWYNSNSAGAQLNILVGSAFGSNPNGRYGVDTSQAGEATLTISNTLLSDDGFYQCTVVDSGILSTSHFGSLTVQFIDGQPNPDVTVPDTTVTLGEDAIITCTYTIFDGRTLAGVSWYNSTSAGAQFSLLVSSAFGSNPNGRYSVDTSQAGVATLTISNTLLSDDGFYQCLVTDSGTLSSSHFGSLTVQFIEVVTINIINSPVTKGKNVTFECSVNANPGSTIILYKEQTEVTREITTNLIYNISNVTKSDAGNYSCEASNSAGTSTSQIEELDVQYSPEIILADYMTVAPGGNAVIAPIVSANPDDITYQWITDPPGIDDIDTNQATFTFKASEVDGTNYTITVNSTNIIGSATKSVKITVSGVDYCVSSPCENEGTCIPPNFEFTCQCKPDYSGKYCENEVSCPACSSSTSLTIGIFFVGIVVGAFGVIAGLVGYTRIKQKELIDKRSADKRKQDTYMDYKADRPTTGNENQTYQDLQHREEEAAYVNVKPGKR